MIQDGVGDGDDDVLNVKGWSARALVSSDLNQIPAKWDRRHAVCMAFRDIDVMRGESKIACTILAQSMSIDSVYVVYIRDSL